MENVLLDTHTLIWLSTDPKKLSRNAEVILNGNNKLFLSDVSVWEMAIKIKTDKLKLKFNLEEFVTRAVEKHSLELLAISLSHIYYTQKLPLHHRDPF